MVVGVIPEQLGASFEDVRVVLYQSFRPRVRLVHLALGAVGTEKPVVTQCSGVLLLRDSDALGGLPLEFVEATRTHRQMREDFQIGHDSSRSPVVLARRTL